MLKILIAVMAIINNRRNAEIESFSNNEDKSTDFYAIKGAFVMLTQTLLIGNLTVLASTNKFIWYFFRTIFDWTGVSIFKNIFITFALAGLFLPPMFILGYYLSKIKKKYILFVINLIGLLVFIFSVFYLMKHPSILDHSS